MSPSLSEAAIPCSGLTAFLDILTEVSADPFGRPEARFELAGSAIGVQSEPLLLGELMVALGHHGTPAGGSNDLDLFAWRAGPSPFDRAPPHWKVAERWARREPVHASGPEGMVFFDPIGGVVSLYDARARLGGLWFPDAAAPALWIAAAPFLRIFDAWFTERGMIVCHGAGIARHGRAALIVGPGGAGKSSLAVHAPEEGFDYIGDDYVLLAPGPPQPTLYSLYSSAKLTGADLEAGIPGQMEVVREPDDKAEKSFLRVSSKRILRSAPLTLVIEPRIGERGPPRTEPITKSDALRAIMPSLFRQLPGEYQGKLAILTRALSPPCIRLHLAACHRSNLALIDLCLAGQVPSAESRS